MFHCHKSMSSKLMHVLLVVFRFINIVALFQNCISVQVKRKKYNISAEPTSTYVYISCNLKSYWILFHEVSNICIYLF